MVATTRSRVYLREEHIWYELPLGGELEPRPLAAVMRLRRLGPRARVTITGDSPLAAQRRRGLGR